MLETFCEMPALLNHLRSQEGVSIDSSWVTGAGCSIRISLALKLRAGSLPRRRCRRLGHRRTDLEISGRPLWDYDSSQFQATQSSDTCCVDQGNETTIWGLILNPSHERGGAFNISHVLGGCRWQVLGSVSEYPGINAGSVLLLDILHGIASFRNAYTVQDTCSKVSPRVMFRKGFLDASLGRLRQRRYGPGVSLF